MESTANKIPKSSPTTNTHYSIITDHQTKNQNLEATMADTDNINRPYKCTVHIALPSNQYAQHLKDVMSVDQEISNKVVKSFAVVHTSPEITDDGDAMAIAPEYDGAGDDAGDRNMRVLQM